MPEPRTEAQVRSEIEAHRNELASSVEALRGEIEEATDIAGKLSARLPLVTAGALGAGFVLAGGIGATSRPGVTGFGAGGGVVVVVVGGGGALPTVNEPFIVVECGSQTYV